MKFLSFVTILTLISCVPKSEIGSTSSSNNTSPGTSASSNYVNPADAQKKLGDSSVPKQCSTFALYLKDNCSTDAAKVNPKCVRTQEYYDTCKELYGQCGVKRASASASLDNSDAIISKNSFQPISGRSLTRGEFSLEMSFLSGVNNACDRTALMLTMCNTRSHYDECSGCKEQINLYETCDQNHFAAECAPLASYYQDCQLPCN